MPKNIPIASSLKHLNPKTIGRNVENPRIEFDEKLMKELKDSINEIGILVPLIVYWDDKVRKYILLDGERRCRCALDLNLPTVPANIIAKPTRLQNILEMFNIHNVRKEWSLTETAWKIQTIINEIGTDNERNLSRLTSLSIGKIRSCKALLSYDKKYQNLAFKNPKEGGIKDNFFVELKTPLRRLEKKYPDLYEKREEQLIDSLIDKYKSGIINNVTEFRKLTKVIKNEKETASDEKIKDTVSKLIDSPSYSIDMAYKDTVEYPIEVTNIEKKCQSLIETLEPLRVDKNNPTNESFKIVLKELINIIKKKLDEF